MSFDTRPRISALFYILRRWFDKITSLFSSQAPTFVIRNSNISLARSTKVTAISAKRNDVRGNDRREKERRRKRDLPMYRAWTQRPGEYISAPGGTISSIKYTPPSLDKLKRRMTVLRRRLSVMRAKRETRKGVSRAYDSVAYQIARTRSILRSYGCYPVTITSRMTLTFAVSSRSRLVSSRFVLSRRW